MSESRYEVRHSPQQSRYTIADGDAGEVGELDYVDVPGEDGRTERVMFHTGVREEHGGQGLASQLVGQAVADAVDAGMAVVPVCPYVASWLPRHPQYAGSVVQPTPAHQQAARTARRG